MFILHRLTSSYLGCEPKSHKAENSIAKENADSWTIKCRKNRSNTNKDDPKNMEIVVAKETFYPMSLSAKAEMVTVTMRNLQFSVSEKDVTFNKADYPGATIIDKR